MHLPKKSQINAAAMLIKARISRKILPPGNLARLDVIERSDRTALIDRGARLGPIFKGLMEDRLAIFVLGNARGRALLREQAAALRPVSIKVDTLFPKGFMRQMDGATHRAYRGDLVRGLASVDMTAWAPRLQGVVEAGLAAHARAAPSGPQSDLSGGRRWSEALSRIATGMLICLVFGVGPEDRAHDRLARGFRDLGPHGLAWTIGDAQIKAFARLRQEASTLGPSRIAPGVMQALAARGPVDDAMLGNLIYMVEQGRYDLRGLLRWISVYGMREPQWLARIADARDTGAGSLAQAFVQEVLRLEQSERLMRNVLRGFDFEGFHFPKGALLRICMWENHKDGTVFDRPFAFDPSRFMKGDPGGDRFSPFGLDHHLCPFAFATMKLAALFTQTLASGYRLEASGSIAPVRGPYHWEPSPDFAPRLARIDPIAR
ncbi:MAG: cytochrome P450 [Paracoccaceae bacterium]|jgi:cytochrome P450